MSMSKGPWKCFHCGEVFETPVEAGMHFGESETEKPACQFTTEEVRELQKMLHRYMDEDTDLHREIHRLHADMNAAVMRAEEEGYARGLRDAGMEIS